MPAWAGKCFWTETDGDRVMTKNKTRRWKRVDASAERLLGELGIAGTEYYTAGGERRVHEALRAWPLLAAVARLLSAASGALRSRSARWRGQGAAEDRSIAVLVPDSRPASPDGADERDALDDPDAAPKEAG